MPGPNSQPQARHPRTGALIKGKTALKAHGLKSREGLTQRDHDEVWARKAAQDINRAVNGLMAESLAELAELRSAL